MDVREALGRAVGGILAPIVAEASLARGAPVLHADGVVLEAEAEPVDADEPLGALGRALQGPALVRFSSALRRYQAGQDPRDALGAAIRFGAGGDKPQDLLFGTFRHLWEIPLAALRTDPHDFLANDYHAVLPFHVPGTETLYTFRLVPEAGAPDGKDRVDRLVRAAAEGLARLRLEARASGDRGGDRTTLIATITLTSACRRSPRGDPLRPLPRRRRRRARRLLPGGARRGLPGEPARARGSRGPAK